MSNQIMDVSEQSIFSHGVRAVTASELGAALEIAGDAAKGGGGGPGYKSTSDADNQSRSFS